MTEPRVRRAKGEERIAEVLLAAEDLLTRRGAEGVSLRDVADAVGHQRRQPAVLLSDARRAARCGVRAAHKDVQRGARRAPRAGRRSRVIELEVADRLLARCAAHRIAELLLVSVGDQRRTTSGPGRSWTGCTPRRTMMAGWLREIHPKLSRGMRCAGRRRSPASSRDPGCSSATDASRGADLKSLQTEIRFTAMSVIDRPAH